jgi:hypothetical protein
MNEYFGILISDLESYDELVDRVRDELIDIYGSIDAALEGEGFYYEDEMILERINETFFDYFEDIRDPQQLKDYWMRNGWVAAGNLSQEEAMWQVAEETNWALLFDDLKEFGEVDEIIGAVLVSLTELNDLVRHGGYSYEFLEKGYFV